MDRKVWWLRALGPLLAGTVFLGTGCRANLDDGAVSAAYAKAKLAYARGEIQEASAQLESLVHRAVGFAPARLLWGRALYFQEAYARAREEFSAVRRAHPESVEAALWLARTEVQAHRPAEAESILTSLRALNPDDPRVAFQLALVRESQKDLTGARDLLDSALQCEADLALVHYERARIYFGLGDRHSAKASLTRAVALVPEGSPVRKPLEDLLANLSEGL